MLIIVLCNLMLYLTVEMEEVVEIVGAQISCAAALLHVLSRGVRLGSVQSAARRVLQRHVDPSEQLSRVVHPRLYSRHHIVWRGTAGAALGP